jgi:hypothetical protein
VTEQAAERSDRDMRREIVLREINQGALAGMQSQITEEAADLVLDALDRYDRWKALRDEMLAARAEVLADHPEVETAAELAAFLPAHFQSAYWDWQLGNYFAAEEAFDA